MIKSFVVLLTLCLSTAWAQEYSPSDVEKFSCDVSDEVGNQITLNGHLTGTLSYKVKGEWKDAEVFKFPIQDLDVDQLNTIRKSCYRIIREANDLVESYKQLKKVIITLPSKSDLKDLEAAERLFDSIKGSDIVKEGAEKDSSPAVVDSDLYPEGKEHKSHQNNKSTNKSGRSSKATAQ